MKIKNTTNQIVTGDFLKATMDIIAENTSLSYSTLAVNGLKERLSREFKFLKNIHIKGSSVEVDKSINSAGRKELRNFFKKIVNFMGPSYLKMLLAQKLNPSDVEYLEDLGLNFG
ncbi:hypothetical protein CMO93_03430 [Candidatus Woesearchaeota archaeon]|nr:hypothetical protein [Candidatus Woesearchaeota archaeon]|tara:strand:- start:1951 stop:2295 length:345 start_codon:yes stop_codon:yes gene_type:complete